MKKITLLLLLLTSLIYAQEFKITKSEIFKDKKKHSFLAYSLDDGAGGVITIRKYLGGFPFKKIKGYYIQHFDKDLKLKNEFDYEVKKNRIEEAFVKDGQLNLIEFEQSSKEKSLIYTVKKSGLDEFNFTSKELLSVSEDNVKNYFGFMIFPIYFDNGLNQMDRNHLGEVVMSGNQKFFAINFDFKDKKQETHKVFVFNDDFELVYDKFIKKDIKDKYFDYHTIEVDDNDGSVYFLGKSYENSSRKERKKGKANYHFELTKINKNEEKSTSFKEPEKSIGSLSLIRTNDQLSCVGFYGNKKEHKYNGVIVYKLNPSSLEINNKKLNPFSEEFLFDKYGSNERKKKRKSKKGITNIVFKSVQALANGDIVINAEEDYITTHTYMSGNGGMVTTTVHHFDDLISLRIDSEGSLKWARNIMKKQTGVDNSSFTPITVGETTYLFINCSDKIKKLRDDRISFKQTSAKKSNLYVVSISGNGKFDYKKLIDKKDSEVYYKVNNGNVDANNNEVTLLGKRKKKSQIIKIKI